MRYDMGDIAYLRGTHGVIEVEVEEVYQLRGFITFVRVSGVTDLLRGLDVHATYDLARGAQSVRGVDHLDTVQRRTAAVPSWGRYYARQRAKRRVKA